MLPAVAHKRSAISSLFLFSAITFTLARPPAYHNGIDLQIIPSFVIRQQVCALMATLGNGRKRSDYTNCVECCNKAPTQEHGPCNANLCGESAYNIHQFTTVFVTDVYKVRTTGSIQVMRDMCLKTTTRFFTRITCAFFF